MRKIFGIPNKLLIITLAILMLAISADAAQRKVFPFYDGLTGGTTGKLDNIDACNANGKGYDLQDQDLAYGADTSGGNIYFYWFDIDSAASESSPHIIKPDRCDGGAYSGDGRWTLLNLSASGASSFTAASGQHFYLYLTADNGEEDNDKFLLNVNDSGVVSFASYAAGTWDAMFAMYPDDGVVIYGKDEDDPATLTFFADQGDDNNDKYRIIANSNGGTFDFDTYESGAWVTILSMDNLGDVTISGNIAGTTYGSDGSISDAELLSIDNRTGVDSNLVTGTAGTDTYYAAWNADGDLVDGAGVPALQSVLGTAISTGLLLDGTDLKVSANLQEYHSVNPSAFALTTFDDADAPTFRSTIGAIGADEKFTMGTTIQETGSADTSPDVSNAALGTNNVYRSNENGTITDFDDSDDHSEFSDGDFFLFIVDDASTVIDFSANANIEGNAGVDFTGSASQIVTILFVYYDARWNAVNFTSGFSAPTTLGISSIDMTGGSIEIPNGTDPDVDAAGEISNDTDGANETGDVTLRGFDGSNQFAFARKLDCIQATIIAPNDLADATRDLLPIWHNTTGMTFTITSIEAWSETDSMEVTLKEYTEEDFSSAANTIDVVNTGTTGTSVSHVIETTISHAAIEANNMIILDFDDTDDPAWFKLSICGWYNANVD